MKLSSLHYITICRSYDSIFITNFLSSNSWCYAFKMSHGFVKVNFINSKRYNIDFSFIPNLVFIGYFLIPIVCHSNVHQFPPVSPSVELPKYLIKQRHVNIRSHASSTYSIANAIKLQIFRGGTGAGGGQGEAEVVPGGGTRAGARIGSGSECLGRW